MLKSFFIVLGLLALPVTTPAGGPAADPAARIYPHNGKGNCERCHVATEEELSGWFTLPSTKKKLRNNFNALCQECHGVEFGHGIGKRTEMNLRDLPMDDEGKIACAITCHSMHVKSADSTQNKFHLRLSPMELCLSCHKK